HERHESRGGASTQSEAHEALRNRQTETRTRPRIRRIHAVRYGTVAYANNPTCPPVCQKRTVWFESNRPSRTYAMSAPSAFAVYVWSTNSASVRATSVCASRDASVGTP